MNGECDCCLGIDHKATKTVQIGSDEVFDACDDAAEEIERNTNGEAKIKDKPSRTPKQTPTPLPVDEKGKTP